MQHIEGNIKTFTAGEALAIHRRVKFDGTNVVYADGAEAGIGVTQEAAASGAPVSVALKTRGRTFIMTAAEALAAGATLYGSDDGKVCDTASGTAIGESLEAATADGDQIECLFV